MKKRKSRLLKSCTFLILVAVGFLFLLSQTIQAKTIELSFALHIPTKAAPYHSAFLPWAKELEKRTQGRLKIKFYPSQTLVKYKDSYDGVVNGIADIAWGQHSMTTGRFPLISVMELPFLVPDTFTGANILNDLYRMFPEMEAEHKDVHLLHLWVSMPYEIHTIKKPIRTLEDIRGLKLATQPGAREATQLLGAVPVIMGTPKIYATVEKGVADGAVLAWGAYKAWKIYEVTKYHTNAHLNGLTYWTVMNKNTWNKLPQDIQQIVTEVTYEMLPEILSRAVTNEKKVGKQLSRDRNHEIMDLTSEERARWVKLAKPIWDKWVKDMEAKGLPGQEVFAKVRRLINKHRRFE